MFEIFWQAIERFGNQWFVAMEDKKCSVADRLQRESAAAEGMLLRHNERSRKAPSGAGW